MFSRHFLICDDDLKRYPPIISNINVLLELNVKVFYIGHCSDSSLLKKLQKAGLVYLPIEVDKMETNPIRKYFRMVSHTYKVKSILKEKYKHTTDLVWVFGNENGWRLDYILKNYRTILYLFEFPFLKIPIKYRFIVPFLNLKKNLQSAWKLVCCEENRGCITEAFFSLNKKPIIIPNKPYATQFSNNKKPEEISNELWSKLSKKDLILYQGAIDRKRRRLDYLCEAMEYLPSKYILGIMASESEDKLFLENKYASDRIIFLPFITPPNHLQITSLAKIGYLTYNTYNSPIEDCINLLFCAPNKVYEYSKYGIPMVSNSLPALKLSFNQFQAGICLDELNARQLAEAVLKIERNYELYSIGSKSLYESIDLKDLIKKLIST